MGASDLVLVAPKADPGAREARQLSTHGEALLDRATVVEDLSSALEGCSLVAATSAYQGGLFRRQVVGTPEAILSRFAGRLDQEKVAMVFGPEDTGLTDEEIALCHFLVQIPTDPSCPVLNLAQAVTICLYELRRQWHLQVPTPKEPMAPFEDQQRAFEHLQSALEKIHFLYGEKGEALMHGLRHLLSRAEPLPMEVRLIFGLARQIEWYVREHSPEETSD